MWVGWPRCASSLGTTLVPPPMHKRSFLSGRKRKPSGLDPPTGPRIRNNNHQLPYGIQIGRLGFRSNSLIFSQEFRALTALGSSRPKRPSQFLPLLFRFGAKARSKEGIEQSVSRETSSSRELPRFHVQRVLNPQQERTYHAPLPTANSGGKRRNCGQLPGL